MKTLFILRHAKAVPDDAYPDDHERPLNARGNEGANQMGAYMKQHGYQPELVLCSTAKRTAETLEAVSSHWEKPAKVTKMESELYLASPGTLLHYIHQADDQYENLLLVSHNPGMHMIALEMVQPGGDEGYVQLRQNFPTAALAAIHFDTDQWSKALPGEGKLLSYMAPKMLD